MSGNAHCEWKCTFINLNSIVREFFKIQLHIIGACAVGFFPNFHQIFFWCKKTGFWAHRDDTVASATAAQRPWRARRRRISACWSAWLSSSDARGRGVAGRGGAATFGLPERCRWRQNAAEGATSCRQRFWRGSSIPRRESRRGWRGSDGEDLRGLQSERGGAERRGSASGATATSVSHGKEKRGRGGVAALLQESP